MPVRDSLGSFKQCSESLLDCGQDHCLVKGPRDCAGGRGKGAQVCANLLLSVTDCGCNDLLLSSLLPAFPTNLD